MRPKTLCGRLVRAVAPAEARGRATRRGANCGLRSPFRGRVSPDARGQFEASKPLIALDGARLMVRGSGFPWASSLLTGCESKRPDASEPLLAISAFNDGVQALLFNPKGGATYPGVLIFCAPVPQNVPTRLLRRVGRQARNVADTASIEVARNWAPDNAGLDGLS